MVVLILNRTLSDGEGMVLQLIYVANASPSPRGSSYIRRNDAQLTMSRRLVQQIEKAKEERVSQVRRKKMYLLNRKSNVRAPTMS